MDAADQPDPHLPQGLVSLHSGGFSLHGLGGAGAAGRRREGVGRGAVRARSEVAVTVEWERPAWRGPQSGGRAGAVPILIMFNDRDIGRSPTMAITAPPPGVGSVVTVRRRTAPPGTPPGSRSKQTILSVGRPLVGPWVLGNRCRVLSETVCLRRSRVWVTATRAASRRVAR